MAKLFATDQVQECGHCGETLPLERFHKDKNRHNGRTSWCKDCACTAVKKRYRKFRDAGLCYACGAPQVEGHKHCARCRVLQKAYRQRLKLQIFDAYGGPECQCCGEYRMEFLSVDHIHGGGMRHRKQKGVANFYEWLKRNDFPPGFRVLCLNCNFAIGHFGQCPHEAERRTENRKKRQRSAKV